MLVALRHRNFRLLWIGLAISFSGTFMQQAALLWHVSLLVPPGRRGFALGMVGLVRVVPIILFSMIAGVAADVFDRRGCAHHARRRDRRVRCWPRWRFWDSDRVADLSARGASVARQLIRSAGPSGARADIVPREHLPNAINSTRRW